MKDFELVWVAFVGWARFPADATEEEIGLAAWRAAACAYVAQAVGKPPNFEGLGFEVHAVDQWRTH